jgi:hypothetical protein
MDTCWQAARLRAFNQAALSVFRYIIARSTTRWRWGVLRAAEVGSPAGERPQKQSSGRTPTKDDARAIVSISFDLNGIGMIGGESESTNSNPGKLASERPAHLGRTYKSEALTSGPRKTPAAPSRCTAPGRARQPAISSGINSRTCPRRCHVSARITLFLTANSHSLHVSYIIM